MNLGNPEEHTIAELASEIVRLASSPSRIVYSTLPMDDPKMRKPDIAKARHELDWHPCVALEQGLIETINDFVKCVDICL